LQKSLFIPSNTRLCQAGLRGPQSLQ